MNSVFVQAQVPFLALVLLIAAISKVATGGPLAGTVRPRWMVLGVAAVECAVGVALLVTQLGAVRLAAAVLFLTTMLTVWEMMRRRSEAGCGCFGGFSTTAPGYRSLARAVLLAVLAGVSAGVPATGFDMLGSPAGVLVAVELVLLVLLSPEPQEIVARRRVRLPCELRDVPLAETYATLRASDAWRTHQSHLTSDEPQEVWRELCHRFVVYPGLHEGRPVDIVFAVPLDQGLTHAAISDPSTQHNDSDTGPQPVHA